MRARALRLAATTLFIVLAAACGHTELDGMRPAIEPDASSEGDAAATDAAAIDASSDGQAMNAHDAEPTDAEALKDDAGSDEGAQPFRVVVPARLLVTRAASGTLRVEIERLSDFQGGLQVALVDAPHGITALESTLAPGTNTAKLVVLVSDEYAVGTEISARVRVRGGDYTASERVTIVVAGPSFSTDPSMLEPEFGGMSVDAEILPLPSGQILAAEVTRGADGRGVGIQFSRQHANGAVDSTFGDQGFEFVDFDDANDILALRATSEGRFLLAVAGHGCKTGFFAPTWPGACKVYVSRHEATAGLDTSFAGGEQVLVEVAQTVKHVELLSQHDGAVTLTVRSYQQGQAPSYLVKRWSKEGDPAVEFGEQGMISVMDPDREDRSVQTRSVSLKDGALLIAAIAFDLSRTSPQQGLALLRVDLATGQHEWRVHELGEDGISCAGEDEQGHLVGVIDSGFPSRSLQFLRFDRSTLERLGTTSNSLIEAAPKIYLGNSPTLLRTHGRLSCLGTVDGKASILGFTPDGAVDLSLGEAGVVLLASDVGFPSGFVTEEQGSLLARASGPPARWVRFWP